MPRIGFERVTASTGEINGREHVVFGGCNYLGLAHHPEVHRAVTEGLARWGLTTTASRETTGNTRAHEAMEREVAAFLGKPAAIMTTEGYTANIALGQGLVGRVRTAIVDERSHSSVMFGLGAPGIRIVTYRHLDAADAIAKAREVGGPSGEGVAVMTDGVFAAGGGVAPVGEILKGLGRRAMMIVDDCHGFVVLGPGGRGTAAHFGVAGDPRVVITTTFGKGLGCYGGAVVGESELIAEVRERSKLYVGTTPAPPPAVEAARVALRLVDREPVLLERLRSNVRRMREVLVEAIGWSALQDPRVVLGARGEEPLVPIFVFVMEPVEEMRRVQAALGEAGIFMPLIDYPGGPTPWYFRPTVTASHSEEQIAALGSALSSAVGAAVRVGAGVR